MKMLLKDYIKKVLKEAKILGIKELEFDIGIECREGLMIVVNSSSNRIRFNVKIKVK